MKNINMRTITISDLTHGQKATVVLRGAIIKDARIYLDMPSHDAWILQNEINGEVIPANRRRGVGGRATPVAEAMMGYRHAYKFLINGAPTAAIEREMVKFSLITPNYQYGILGKGNGTSLFETKEELEEHVMKTFLSGRAIAGTQTGFKIAELFDVSINPNITLTKIDSKKKKAAKKISKTKLSKA